jgi:hypothetical protein
LNFVKCYDIISFFWYIHELFKHLRQYLQHCSNCQIFQTRRHKSYEYLQSMLISNVSFHIITIDFILALSDIEKYDCALFVTCKFFKRIFLIFEKINWKAKNWVMTLLTRLEIMNWELFKVIIFDRDSKFLVDLWKIIFDRLSVKLLYSTAYHSQTDEQFERINQTVKIALRYQLTSMTNIKKWSRTLFIIQFHMNNSIFSLEKTLNEIVYEFISIQFFDLTKENNSSQEDYVTLMRKKIFDVIAWTQMQMKHHYDRKHQSLNLKIDDHVLLRLHKEYNISSAAILSRKLSQQYVDSFRILEKIENLAYRLSLSKHWNIHFIIFIAQLESISNSIIDFYNRSRSNESKSIHVEEDIETIKSFKIEKLINKQITARRETKYLIRWKNYDSQYDEWRSILELENVSDLIIDYETIMKNFIFLSDRLSRKALKTSQSFETITNNSINTSSSRITKNNSLDIETLKIRRFTKKIKNITRTWRSFSKKTYVTK